MTAKDDPDSLPWWFEFLHQGPASSWMRLAACSANRAMMTQSAVRNSGRKDERYVDLRDSKKTRDWLSRQVRDYPDALADRWVLIQCELFRDFIDGNDAFARNIAKQRKHCKSSIDEARAALLQGEKKSFNQAMDQIFSNEPGQYAGELERFMVRHWVTRPEPDLPPFCCWKDEALSDYLAERSGSRYDKGTYFIEDRRTALGLLKVPAYVVVEWRRGSPGQRGRPIFDLNLREKLDLDRDAFRWVCGHITWDVFIDAFGVRDDEFTICAKQFLRFPISESLKAQLLERLG